VPQPKENQANNQKGKTGPKINRIFSKQFKRGMAGVLKSVGGKSQNMNFLGLNKEGLIQAL
jgi:hypothetical protein